MTTTWIICSLVFLRSQRAGFKLFITWMRQLRKPDKVFEQCLNLCSFFLFSAETQYITFVSFRNLKALMQPSVESRYVFFLQSGSQSGRHLSFTMPLSAQAYNWVPANCLLSDLTKCLGYPNIAQHHTQGEEAFPQIALFYENLELFRLWFDPGATFFFFVIFLSFWQYRSPEQTEEGSDLGRIESEITSVSLHPMKINSFDEPVVLTLKNTQVGANYEFATKTPKQNQSICVIFSLEYLPSIFFFMLGL